MAKVDTITLHVEGKEYKYNINVSKSGMFSCSIDWFVAKRIGLDSVKLEFSKLNDLWSYILTPYHKYLDSKVEETLWIGIVYTVNGFFATNPETGEQFCSALNGDEFRSFYDNKGFSTDPPKMGFSFEVFFKESRSTGIETWHNARKNNPCNPDVWNKYGIAHSVPKILIPYSDEAYKTLQKAKKGLQEISFTLFKVLSQDKQTLVDILEAGRTLTYSTQSNDGTQVEPGSHPA